MSPKLYVDSPNLDALFEEFRAQEPIIPQSEFLIRSRSRDKTKILQGKHVLIVRMVLGLLSIISAQCANEQSDCQGLTAVVLDHATVEASQWMDTKWIDTKPLKLPPDLALKVPGIEVPGHCEVSGVARPTSDSAIRFVLWLPAPEAWNGKYMQRGNGGWAGSIQLAELITPLVRGYATSGTDDGHQASGQDASWAIGHPEKLIDFGFRSVHETAIHAKAILQAYYGKSEAHAYFAGCSAGGREALMEAQRYPEDFDGIVAGAPANNWTNQFSGFAWNEVALHRNSESNIPVEKLRIIQKAALTACDALDGVRDGLIQDPRQCHYNPSDLKCKGPDSKDCLTQPQIDSLERIYSGPKNPRTSEQIYPGYEPGSEQAAWPQWIVGPIQPTFANSFFSGAVFENPNWNWRTIDFDRDVQLANVKTGWILNSYSPDLRTFRAHGGKLIQYHGWSDPAVAPRDSINFYEKVGAFLERYPDSRSATGQEISVFYRLFMVPGMHHCWGGNGAANFGNTLISYGSGAQQDADHDVLSALDRWVTGGVAPDKIVATGKLSASSDAGAAEASVTRPLCAYPSVARYRGRGDTNAASSFDCVSPPKDEGRVR